MLHELVDDVAQHGQALVDVARLLQPQPLRAGLAHALAAGQVHEVEAAVGDLLRLVAGALAVVERDRDALGAGDDVLVGDDVALGIDQEAASELDEERRKRLDEMLAQPEPAVSVVIGCRRYIESRRRASSGSMIGMPSRMGKASPACSLISSCLSRS